MSYDIRITLEKGESRAELEAILARHPSMRNQSCVLGSAALEPICG